MSFCSGLVYETKILKYPLIFNGEGEVKIEMAADAKTLCVQMQNGIATLWAEVPHNLRSALNGNDGTLNWEGKPPYLRMKTFYIYATGQEFDRSSVSYITTIQDANFVWHIYEER